MATVNLVVLLCLMLVAEVAYRVYRDGFSGAITNAFSRQAPYSDLGTSNWVIDDPDVGYRLNPAREEINSRSVRHAEIAVPKRKSVFRIILLGDSIPAARNGFPDALRESLARVGDIELINAAVPGYTSFQEVEFFKRYLKDTEPDLILWTYCLNDNHRFLHVFDRNAGMLWTDEARRSVQTNSTLDGVIGHSHLLTSLRLGLANWRRNRRDAQAKYPWETAIDFNVAWKDYSWVEYERNLRELKTILGEQSARLAIVIFPYEAQLRLTGAPDEEYVLKPQRKMRALCEKYGVPCLDPFPLFAERNARGERLFEDGIHLNKAGHDLTAKEIFRFLAQQELVPVRGRVGRAKQVSEPTIMSTLGADPNPVPAGAGPGLTTITWNSGNGFSAQVYLAGEGQQEPLFAASNGYQGFQRTRRQFVVCSGTRDTRYLSRCRCLRQVALKPSAASPTSGLSTTRY